MLSSRVNIVITLNRNHAGSFPFWRDQINVLIFCCEVLVEGVAIGLLTNVWSWYKIPVVVVLGIGITTLDGALTISAHRGNTVSTCQIDRNTISGL